MEKRRVAVRIGGQTCSFYTDDSDEYISDLERRANAVMIQTARFSGPSANMNAVLSVVSLTDALMRAEMKAAELQAEKKTWMQGRPETVQEIRPSRKNKVAAVDQGQVSVWELMDES